MKISRFFINILKIIREKQYVNSCHGNHTKDFFTNLLFSETLKGISDALQNLMFVQLSVNEVVSGGPDNPHSLV